MFFIFKHNAENRFCKRQHSHPSRKKTCKRQHSHPSREKTMILIKKNFQVPPELSYHSWASGSLIDYCTNLWYTLAAFLRCNHFRGQDYQINMVGLPFNETFWCILSCDVAFMSWKYANWVQYAPQVPLHLLIKRNDLTHCCLVTHVFVSDLSHCWFR